MQLNTKHGVIAMGFRRWNACTARTTCCVHGVEWWNDMVERHPMTHLLVIVGHSHSHQLSALPFSLLCSIFWTVFLFYYYTKIAHIVRKPFGILGVSTRETPDKPSVVHSITSKKQGKQLNRSGVWIFIGKSNDKGMVRGLCSIFLHTLSIT